MNETTTFEEIKINEWFRFKDQNIPLSLLTSPSTPFKKVFMDFDVLTGTMSSVGFTDFRVAIPYRYQNCEVVPVKNP